ncbi:MAG: hypothetical protein HZA20_02755 [Nitrospirae bacterium]|nr:hypothetical protein [Nitrospirota bacterium]
MFKASLFKNILLFACILSIIALSPQPAQCGYANTIIVAKSGGNYTKIKDAVNAAKALNPSKTNPVLIQIMPGLFSSSDLIELPPYVDIEGAGVNMTVIQRDYGFGGYETMLASGSPGATREVRNLTVEVLGLPDDHCGVCGTQVGVKVTNGASLTMQNIKFVPNTGSYRTMGVLIASETGETELRDVTISSLMTGVSVNSGGKARLYNTKILDSVSSAVQTTVGTAASGWLVLQDCQLSVAWPTVYHAINGGELNGASGSMTIYVANSYIYSGIVSFSSKTSAVLVNSLIGTLPIQTSNTTALQCRNLFDHSLNDVTCP